MWAEFLAGATDLVSVGLLVSGAVFVFDRVERAVRGRGVFPVVSFAFPFFPFAMVVVQRGVGLFFPPVVAEFSCCAILFSTFFFFFSNSAETTHLTSRQRWPGQRTNARDAAAGSILAEVS